MAVATEQFIYPADVDSATTEVECHRLWELANGKVCLELGSWKGATAIVMAQSAERVHCVDHFCGDMHTGYGPTLGEFLGNLGRYGVTRKVTTHVGSFEHVLPLFRPDSFGLVFCDGLHTKEATELQAAWALDLVAPGGTVCFHDYTNEHDLVAAGFAVMEVVDELDGDPEVVDTLAILEV